MTMLPPHLLPDAPVVPASIAERVLHDYEQPPLGIAPHSMEDYLLDRYGIDIASTYAGLPIRNPWGKASGQLSMTGKQVSEENHFRVLCFFARRPIAWVINVLLAAFDIASGGL